MIRTLWVFASASLAFVCGCSELDNCPDANDEKVPVDNGPPKTPTLVYSSAPWEGPRDPFPAKTLMTFVHYLGATPEIVTSYVSFSREGTDVTENAGNQGRIRCVDDEEIWIKNDTCEEAFFIRVAASASGEMHTDCSCAGRFAEPPTCTP